MPNTRNDKVLCETPTPGKQPTRIDRWKYKAVSQAILTVLPARGDGVPFSELAQRVAQTIDKSLLEDLGSVSWYTTTVKLDLECKKLIQRVPGSSPQRLLRAPPRKS